MQSISKRPFSQLSAFRLLSMSAICALLLAASPARAQDPVAAPLAPPSAEAPPVATLAAPQTLHYGQMGQWFVSAETFWTAFNGNSAFGGNTGDLSFSWDSSENSGKVFNFNIQPVAGYFLTELVYARLGFELGYSHSSADGAATAQALSLGVEPGIGISLPIANRISFAPWIGLNLLYLHVFEDTPVPAADNVRLNLEVHAPLVFDIADHLAFTAGVYYAQGLVNHTSTDGRSGDGPKAGSVGLTGGLIGYW